jgi:hypothetical protein
MDNNLKGAIGVEIVKAMLENSGYTVCHYGYEYTLLDLLSKSSYGKSKTPTGSMLAASPDLLVYDKKDEVMLVEVKTRTKSKYLQKGEFILKSSEIKRLKDFWSSSIIVIISPEGIFAQRASDIQIRENDHQHLSDFDKFQYLFKKVGSEVKSHYEDIASQILQIWM